jgi:hypothetical protein
MTRTSPIAAAARNGWRRSGKQPDLGVAARCMGVVLAVALFSVDTFQPIIGLVEVSKTSDKAQVDGRTSPDSKPDQIPQPVVVSIHAWQWNQPNSELWPAFVFLPTISAGSGSTARSVGSVVSQGGAAALAPLPLAWSQSAPLPLPCLAQQPGEAAALRLAWCREICPIGPPAA